MTGRRRQPVQVQFGRWREVKPRELLLRFAFGAGVSVLAGLAGTVAGSRVGGVFLAFPAILLASLTLIADEEGLTRARDDARGAGLGAAALVVFAAAAGVLLPHGAPAALWLAFAGWLGVALLLYAVAWWLGRGNDEPTGDRLTGGASDAG